MDFLSVNKWQNPRTKKEAIKRLFRKTSIITHYKGLESSENLMHSSMMLVRVFECTGLGLVYLYRMSHKLRQHHIVALLICVRIA